MPKLSAEVAAQLRNKKFIAVENAPPVEKLRRTFQAAGGSLKMTYPSNKEEQVIATATMGGVDFRHIDDNGDLAAAKAVGAAIEEMMPEQTALDLDGGSQEAGTED